MYKKYRELNRKSMCGTKADEEVKYEKKWINSQNVVYFLTDQGI
jgi:hypothetical protein